MKKVFWLIVTGLVSAEPALCEPATGTWTGAIDGHIVSLVHIETGSDGKLVGTFASHQAPLETPDFYALKTTIDDVVATADHLSFSVPGNSGLFDGRWDSANASWIGTFQWGKGGYVSHLNLKRTDLVSLPPAAVPVTYASPADETQALDQFVHAYVDDGRFMGSVLVMQNGKVLLDKGYGMADIARKRPNTPDTAYHIGSITKQFTAAAILLLQEQGKLKISDSVRAYLPDTPASWDQITLFDLLTHTSGLGDDGDDFAGRWAQDVTPAQLLAAIRGETLKFQPGSEFSYSNAGYAVLGMVIEKASGRSYGDFLSDNLFRPLGMTSTAYNPPLSAVQAQGYDGSVDGPIPTRNPLALSLGYAAGGIVSTTHDMALWQTKLLGGQVLSPASLQQMITPYKDNYGFGVEVVKNDGHLDVKHNGNVPGFRTTAHYEPDQKLNVVVLGNLNTLGPIFLGYDLIKLAHGMPGRLPPKPYPVSPKILASYAGTYVMSPKLKFVVYFEKGRLIAEGGDYPKFVLYATSETAFYSKSLEYDVTTDFVKSANGTMSFILHNEGQPDLSGTREVR